ncbi:hypothetical protein GCM10028813_22860 [Ramlibacter alkalitolerans]
MQRHHRVGAEALLEARLQLRREVDLRHQHERLRLRIAREQRLDGAQVDLGLAAAGGAEQQEGARFGGNGGEGLGLLVARRRASCTASSPRNCGGSAASATSPRLRW